MAGQNRLIGAVAACAIVLSATCVLAEDSPQWRGPNRDGKVTGFTAPATWPKTLTQKWKVTVGAGDATPALVGEKLYVFARQDGDEVTSCLDATTGKELWKDTFAVPAIAGPAARQHAGPRSSPAVADGKIVTLGVTGVLTCLDAASGKVLWRNQDFKGVPKFYTASSPMIVDGMCVAQVGGADNGAIVALDLATGTEKWKWTGESPDYASPVLLTADGVKQIVALSNKSVVGISLADGKPLWQIPFAAQGMAYNAATPIVDGQTVIYAGQGRGAHAVKIEKQGDGFVVKELWSNPSLAVQFSNPVLKDGMVYAISDKGNLWCMDAQTGKTIWTDPARRGAYGPMLDLGSAIMTLTEKSELIAFKPGEKQYTELTSIKVADSPTYASPVVAGNAVYVKDQNALTMWTLE
jgi:outer membrane protein assembly factor BamB